jgi:hypothetical protein
LLAKGHTRDTVYVRTYVQTQYDQKRHKKMKDTIFYPQTVDEILSMVLANEEIKLSSLATGPRFVRLEA